MNNHRSSYSTSYQDAWACPGPSSSPPSDVYSSSPYHDRGSSVQLSHRRRSRSPDPGHHRHESAMPTPDSVSYSTFDNGLTRNLSHESRYSSSHSNSHHPVWYQSSSWRAGSQVESHSRAVEQACHSYPTRASASDSLARRGDDADRTMPKNFTRPLTCFYWHTQGRCTKSDEECWYAHHDTGVYAAAPIRTGTGEVAVAGRSANNNLDYWNARETALRAREDAVAAMQKEVGEQQEVVARNLEQVKTVVIRTFQCLSTLEKTATQARDVVETKQGKLGVMLSQHILPSNVPESLKRTCIDVKAIMGTTIENLALVQRSASELERHMSRNISVIMRDE